MMVLCGLKKQRVKPVIRRPGNALGGEGEGVHRDWLCDGKVGGASMVFVISTLGGTLLGCCCWTQYILWFVGGG